MPDEPGSKFEIAGIRTLAYFEYYAEVFYKHPRLARLFRDQANSLRQDHDYYVGIHISYSGIPGIITDVGAKSASSKRRYQIATLDDGTQVSFTHLPYTVGVKILRTDEEIRDAQRRFRYGKLQK